MATGSIVRGRSAGAKSETVQYSAWHRAILLWHLLSLDAPCVAVVWTWTIAAANHLRLPSVTLLAMGIAVWMLYAADRLLDGRGIDIVKIEDRSEIEARHRFHHEHRRWFRFGIGTASIALAMLLPRIPPSAMHSYLILGGLLAGYFVVIHVAPTERDPSRSAPRLPKEIAVGIFFAAAVFIPTVARQPELRLQLLPAALLLAALCSLNCLYIYRWEHTDLQTSFGGDLRADVSAAKPAISPSGPSLRVHWATRWALASLPLLTFAVIGVGSALAINRSMNAVIPLACAIAGGLLLALDHVARRTAYGPIGQIFGKASEQLELQVPPRIDRTLLRAAADLCLLTPLLLLPWLLRQ